MSADALFAEAMFTKMETLAQQFSGNLRELTNQTARAETAGGVRAFTLANAPLAVDGGMSNGTQYIDMVWISNGRKPTEGAGLGTGVLAVYSATANAYQRVGDYSLVVI